MGDGRVGANVGGYGGRSVGRWVGMGWGVGVGRLFGWWWRVGVFGWVGGECVCACDARPWRRCVVGTAEDRGRKARSPD